MSEEEVVDDGPICAKCGSAVHVADGLEWSDGDLCYSCLADEFPKLQRAIAAKDAVIDRLRYDYEIALLVQLELIDENTRLREALLEARP